MCVTVRVHVSLNVCICTCVLGEGECTEWRRRCFPCATVSQTDRVTGFMAEHAGRQLGRRRPRHPEVSVRRAAAPQAILWEAAKLKLRWHLGQAVDRCVERSIYPQVQ